MPNYRRRHHEWGCYFLTVVTNKRHPLFRDPHARELLKKAIQDTLATQPMTIHEMVLLPDHLHILCSLPEPKQDYSTRIRLIKKRFTRAISRARRYHEGTDFWKFVNNFVEDVHLFTWKKAAVATCTADYQRQHYQLEAELRDQTAQHRNERITLRYNLPSKA